jgi:hypothetical protein
MPERTMLRKTSTSRLAGPIVQTILALRIYQPFIILFMIEDQTLALETSESHRSYRDFSIGLSNGDKISEKY